MAIQKALPTCPCGSTEFEEVQTPLTMMVKAQVTTAQQTKNYWARICQQCSQITFWSLKRQANSFQQKDAIP